MDANVKSSTRNCTRHIHSCKMSWIHIIAPYAKHYFLLVKWSAAMDNRLRCRCNESYAQLFPTVNVVEKIPGFLKHYRGLVRTIV